MRDLSYVLQYGFQHACYNSGIGYTNPDVNDKPKYMVIPIDKERFEIPAFALYALDKAYPSQNVTFEEIVVKLNYVGVNSYYKTMDAAIRDALVHAYSSTRLHRLPRTGDPERTYYVTQGGIFDNDFNPVMLLTWELEKVPNTTSLRGFDYMFRKPILRVIPKVIINKSNALERYIVNKILPNVLNIYSISKPYMSLPFFTANNNITTDFKPKVVIEKIPFEIKKADVPSVSTTNETLMKVALDNLEELVQ